MINLPIKQQLALFLLGFAICLSLFGQATLSVWVMGCAVISSLIAESILLFVREKKWRLTESSIVSGLIIGLVLANDEPLWKIFLVCAFAIISKQLIRLKGKHIFNPAACGLLLGILFLGIHTQWSGTYKWFILIPFGLYFIYKIRKLELLFSYFLVTLSLLLGLILIRKLPLTHVFGYFSYFFIFIMLIEPKTTPVKKKGKIIFGAGVAILAFIFNEIGLKVDAELTALLCMNSLVSRLNKFS